MPIYEYQCQDCDNRFEVLTTSSAETEKVKCDKCDSIKVQKLMSAGNFKLGSGGSFPSAPASSCGGGSGFS